jgi:hypothetical protein
MTQTLYAHVKKKKINKKNLFPFATKKEERNQKH